MRLSKRPLKVYNNKAFHFYSLQYGRKNTHLYMVGFCYNWSMADMNELIKRTINWGEGHGINNPWTQASKVTEEWGETVSEMNHDRYGDAFEDGIGDVLVSLIIFAHINGKDVSVCLEKALKEIENRSGHTLDGNFLKDE